MGRYEVASATIESHGTYIEKNELATTKTTTTTTALTTTSTTPTTKEVRRPHRPKVITRERDQLTHAHATNAGYTRPDDHGRPQHPVRTHEDVPGPSLGKVNRRQDNPAEGGPDEPAFTARAFAGPWKSCGLPGSTSGRSARYGVDVAQGRRLGCELRRRWPAAGDVEQRDRGCGAAA